MRTIAHCDKRIQEAAKLGFKKIVIPKSNAKKMKSTNDISIVGVETIQEAMKELVE